MDVVKAIDDIGSPTGRPLERVTIDSVVIPAADSGYDPGLEGRSSRPASCR